MFLPPKALCRGFESRLHQRGPSANPETAAGHGAVTLLMRYPGKRLPRRVRNGAIQPNMLRPGYPSRFSISTGAGRIDATIAKPLAAGRSPRTGADGDAEPSQSAYSLLLV